MGGPNPTDCNRISTNKMKSIIYSERELTNAEFARMNEGFNEHTLEHGNPIQTDKRYGFVCMEGEIFIGCSSGLMTLEEGRPTGWFYLTDLFVEKEYRGSGIGAQLLRQLEETVSRLGATQIWTWTAGFEAPGFYLKQGYHIFCELESWYASGHSRVGLRKKL